MPVEQKNRGEMADQGGANEAGLESQSWFEHAPKVSDALKKGAFVSIVTWGGRELAGTICDREQTGVLLDTSESEDGPDGYVFLPWTSIEQLYIRAVTPRRVKVLPS